MISKDLSQASGHMADQAARSADQAIDATRSAIGQKIDGMADTVRGLQDQAAPLLDRATDVAKRGVDAARDTSADLINRAGKATDATVGYVKDEPVKAMLIAAAVGAALMALMSAMSRGGRN